MVWWVPVAMAVAGAAEGDAKRKRNEKKLQAQAEIARWSPWTGMQPHDVSTEDSAIHGAMQGGVAGMGMTQNMNGDDATPKKDASLTGDTGASSESYSRPANTSNMSLPPAAPAAPAEPAQKYNFDTQAEPNMSQETLSPEDAALKRKFPWAKMPTGTVNQSRMR